MMAPMPESVLPQHQDVFYEQVVALVSFSGLTRARNSTRRAPTFTLVQWKF